MNPKTKNQSQSQKSKNKALSAKLKTIVADFNDEMARIKADFDRDLKKFHKTQMKRMEAAERQAENAEKLLEELDEIDRD